MKKIHFTNAVLPLLLILLSPVNAHSQASKTKLYSIEKKATIELNGTNDAWSPLLKNHQLPKPDDGADEELKNKIKGDLIQLYGS
ncbi:MAG: hypothetical protein JJE25_02720, partial [Bacteroidia bacterium]|nr:hypothetical protein [Bacteroidia bacterium]